MDVGIALLWWLDRVFFTAISLLWVNPLAPDFLSEQYNRLVFKADNPDAVAGQRLYLY